MKVIQELYFGRLRDPHEPSEVSMLEATEPLRDIPGR